MKFLVLLLFIVSCSSTPMLTPKHAVVDKVDKYISPDKKIEVNI